MISPRIYPLVDSYEILERLRMNTPFYIPISFNRIDEVLNNLENMQNRSSQIAIRFDKPPSCKPSEFYSLVSRLYPECVYIEPRDRNSERWVKKPHLIGEYCRMKILFRELSKMCQFSGVIDYEKGNQHYFQTQQGGFNLYLSDKTHIAIVLGRKTVRYLDNMSETVIENDKVVKGEIPNDMKNEIIMYSHSAKDACEIWEIGNLVFENSIHSIESGKQRKRVVTWDILPDGTIKGKESIERLRHLFL
jgi:hypothetical protein